MFLRKRITRKRLEGRLDVDLNSPEGMEELLGFCNQYRIDIKHLKLTTTHQTHIDYCVNTISLSAYSHGTIGTIVEGVQSMKPRIGMTKPHSPGNDVRNRIRVIVPKEDRQHYKS